MSERREAGDQMVSLNTNNSSEHPTSNNTSADTSLDDAESLLNHNLTRVKNLDASNVPKKKSSFQITGIINRDQELDALDDLDENHTEDISSEVFDLSKATDLETEPDRSSDETLQSPSTEDLKNSIFASLDSKSADIQSRFKVVRIESSEPFKKGRWVCNDYYDPPEKSSSVERGEKNIIDDVGSAESSASSSCHYIHGIEDQSKMPPVNTTLGYPEPVKLLDQMAERLGSIPASISSQNGVDYRQQPIQTSISQSSVPFQTQPLSSTLPIPSSQPVVIGGRNTAQTQQLNQVQQQQQQQAQQQVQHQQQIQQQQTQHPQQIQHQQQIQQQSHQQQVQQQVQQQQHPQNIQQQHQKSDVVNAIPYQQSSIHHISQPSSANPNISQSPHSAAIVQTNPNIISQNQQQPSSQTLGSHIGTPSKKLSDSSAPPVDFHSVVQGQIQASDKFNSGLSNKDFVHDGQSQQITQNDLVSSINSSVNTNKKPVAPVAINQTSPNNETIIQSDNHLVKQQSDMINVGSKAPSAVEDRSTVGLQGSSISAVDQLDQRTPDLGNTMVNHPPSVTGSTGLLEEGANKPPMIISAIQALTAPPLLEMVSATMNNRNQLSDTLKDGDSSGASTVAIDNKIEQAMDLVKSHLMFAVREEVEVLKGQIKELLEKNSQLERENSVLKAAASADTLAKLKSHQAAAAAAAAAAAVAAQSATPSAPAPSSSSNPPSSTSSSSS